MRIMVDRDIRLDDVDNLRDLAVVTAFSARDLDRRLRSAGLGYATAQHAWLHADPLRDRGCESSSDTAWVERYEDMVEYARGKGWWDETTRSVRAHIVDRGDRAAVSATDSGSRHP